MPKIKVDLWAGTDWLGVLKDGQFIWAPASVGQKVHYMIHQSKDVGSCIEACALEDEIIFRVLRNLDI